MARAGIYGFILCLSGTSYAFGSSVVGSFFTPYSGLVYAAPVNLVIALLLLWASSHLISQSSNPTWAAIIIALSLTDVIVLAAPLFGNQSYYSYGNYPTTALLLIPGPVIALLGGILGFLGPRGQAYSVPTGLYETGQPPIQAMLLAICPACKARIPADVKFCAQCGTDLRPTKA